MKKLIKNGDIILDGTQTREQAEKEAFIKLEEIENVLAKHKINDIDTLDNLLLWSLTLALGILKLKETLYAKSKIKR